LGLIAGLNRLRAITGCAGVRRSLRTQWDAEGRLKSLDSGATTTILYDALGNRAERYNSSGTVDFVRDLSGNIIGGAGGTGAIFNTFIWADGRMIADYESAGAYLDHVNNIGTTSQGTDWTGTNLQEQLLYPWGQPWASASYNIHSVFGSMPGYDPDLGEYQTQFRTYPPTQGRWLSPDPGSAGASIGDPQSWNAYTYANNSPLVYVDPEGTDAIIICTSVIIGGKQGDSGCQLGVDNSALWGSEGGQTAGSGGGSGGGGGNGGGTGGGSGSGGGSHGLFGKLIGKVCSALPSGRVTAIGGTAGFFGGITGSVEEVINYNTGERSLFYAGGTQVGFNGGPSAYGSAGLIMGSLNTNSQYSGPFTSVSGTGVPTGVPFTSAGGSIASSTATGGGKFQFKQGGPTAVAASINVSPVPLPFGSNLSFTNYSNPIPAGSFLNQPDGPALALDLIGILARRPCQ
jgi:RHS repeat-associated protein